eukprot:31089-Pelagococcus_subviridis.AAC.8
MNSLLSAFSSTRTSANPASVNIRTRSAATGAPATQHDSASAVFNRAGSSAVETTSLIASRPPGFRTRSASRSTLGLSGERFTTQLLRVEGPYEAMMSGWSSQASGGNAPDHDVHLVVRARQILDLSQSELNARRGEAARFRALARALEHVRGHVHADHDAAPPDVVRGEEAVDPRAASEVEDGFPRSERREPRGRAAADAEVGVAREREVLARVPDRAAVGRGRDAAPAVGGGHLGVVRGDGRALRVGVRRR